MTPSIGISLYPEHAQVPTELLKHADTAMYQAKAMGRHTYQVYAESMDEKNRHRAILASALRRAIDRNELSLVFQPRLAIAQQRITGVEALLPGLVAGVAAAAALKFWLDQRRRNNSEDAGVITAEVHSNGHAKVKLDSLDQFS